MPVMRNRRSLRSQRYRAIEPSGWTKLVPITKGDNMRFPQLTLDQLNEQQKPLGDQIMTVSSLGIGGPYNLLLRSPVLGQRLYDLFYYLRWQTSVPTRLNEFAIL